MEQICSALMVLKSSGHPDYSDKDNEKLDLFVPLAEMQARVSLLRISKSRSMNDNIDLRWKTLATFVWAVQLSLYCGEVR